MASEFAYTADKEGAKNESSLKRYMRFLFQKVEIMSDTYNYAKKYKVLHPVAWVHHLARGVLNGIIKRTYKKDEGCSNNFYDYTTLIL